MSGADYPLHSLLTVREYRENKAHSAAEQAMRAAREAREALELARRTLEDYRRRRREEEEQRYAAVLGKALDTHAVDRFRAGLVALMEEEARLLEETRKAEVALSARQEEERLAAEGLRQAVRDHARIKEHRRVWRDEAQREAERQEEKEQESRLWRPQP